MSTVKISEIAMPEHYLRAKVKTSYINELLTDLALINGVKDWHELIAAKEKKVKVEWPFPPIEVARNEKQVLPPAEKGEKRSDVKKKIKVSKKKYFLYEMIDGSHRITVARRLKMKEILTTVKNIPNHADRFLEQYKSNGGPRGLRLDKDDRDNAIRILAKEYGLSQKVLVQETGLDQASISRIIAAKQRSMGARKSSKKKSDSDDSGSAFTQGSGATRSSAASEATMSVNGFIERLQICCSELPKLKSGVVAELNLVSNEKGLTLLIERVKEILDMLEVTRRTKFPPKITSPQETKIA